LSFLIHAALRP